MDELWEAVEYPIWMDDDEKLTLPKSSKPLKITQNDRGKSGKSYNSNSTSTNIYIDDSEMTDNMDLNGLSRDIGKMDLKRDNVPQIIKKPPNVDRSSKPSMIEANPIAQSYIKILSELNELGDTQEKLEKQLAQLCDETYLKVNNYDLEYLKEQKDAVMRTLEATVKIIFFLIQINIYLF